MNSFKKPLLLSAASAFAISVGATSYAQEVEQIPSAKKEEKADEQKVDEVISTGTRIRGASITSNAVTITQEDIKAQGVTSVEELMASISQNVANTDAASSLTATNSINFGGGGGINGLTSADELSAIGVGGVNLRGLGAEFSLVLLNGRRLAGAAGLEGGFANITQIPLNAIERVEIIYNGAAAIYGSDAVGGVINFITKKNYTGYSANATYENSSTDADRYQAAFNIGHAWGSGNAALNGSFTKSYAATNSKLGWTTQNQCDRTPDGLRVSECDRRSARNGAQPGIFQGPSINGQQTYYTLRDGADPLNYTQDDVVVFDRDNFRDVVPLKAGGESESIQLDFSAEQEVFDGFTARGALVYSRDEFVAERETGALNYTLLWESPYNNLDRSVYDRRNRRDGVSVFYYPEAEIAAGQVPAFAELSNTSEAFTFDLGFEYAPTDWLTWDFNYRRSTSVANGSRQAFSAIPDEGRLRLFESVFTEDFSREFTISNFAAETASGRPVYNCQANPNLQNDAALTEVYRQQCLALYGYVVDDVFLQSDEQVNAFLRNQTLDVSSVIDLYDYDYDTYQYIYYYLDENGNATTEGTGPGGAARQSLQQRRGTVILPDSLVAAPSADVVFNPLNDGSWTRGAPVSVFFAPTADIANRTGSEQFESVIRGQAFELPGGKVGFAVGGEHRRARLRNNSLTSQLEASPQTKIYAAFGELSLPVIGPDLDIPLLRSLTINPAARYDRYSTTGPVGLASGASRQNDPNGPAVFVDSVFDRVSPSLGVHWEVTESLSFTGNWSTGFRAPSFSSLYSLNAREREVEIRNDPHVDGNFDTVESYDVTQISGPNPDLKPQTSEGYNIAMIWRPVDGPLEGLQVRSSYSEVTIKNGVTSLPSVLFQVGFDEAYALQEFFPRDPETGRIRLYRNTPVNIASQENAVWEVSVQYDFSTPFGDFRPRVEFIDNLVSRQTIFEDIGAISSLGYRTGPDRHNINGQLAYNYNAFTANLFVRHGADHINRVWRGTRFRDEIAHVVPGVTTVDLTANYDVNDRVSVSFGGRNILNEKHPFSFSRNGAGAPFDPSKLSTRGRVFSLRLTYQN